MATPPTETPDAPPPSSASAGSSPSLAPRSCAITLVIRRCEAMAGLDGAGFAADITFDDATSPGTQTAYTAEPSTRHVRENAVNPARAGRKVHRRLRRAAGTRPSSFLATRYTYHPPRAKSAAPHAPLPLRPPDAYIRRSQNALPHSPYTMTARALQGADEPIPQAYKFFQTWASCPCRFRLAAVIAPAPCRAAALLQAT